MNFFKKGLSEIPSECQTVLIQIRLDVLSGLIRVQTNCKGYQQMTKVTTSWERVKISNEGLGLSKEPGYIWTQCFICIILYVETW